MSQHIDDADTVGYNDSPNPDFQSVLESRLSRRSLLAGGASASAAMMLGGVGAAAQAATPAGKMIEKLKFNPVAKSVADVVSVPEGYTARVLYALGDPIAAGVPDFRNDGTDTQFELRAGDHHDGMDYFGLSSDGLSPDPLNERHAVLAMNHEALTDNFLHVGGSSPRPRPASESDKEIPAHGVSLIEIGRPRGGEFKVKKRSRYNRRITPLTPALLTGPVSGSALTRTLYSPSGIECRGTINNCGTGRTPWGTLLTGEENWAGYFTRNAADNTARNNDKSVASLNRYGRAAGATSRHGWETSGTDDKYRRWDISKTGASPDGTDDYRNELNTFGYLVEIDPYDPASAPRKRTALGRFAHESGAFSHLVAGRRLAVYMGDDSVNEYIYKYVSDATWSAADAESADRLAVGAKFLDHGKLFVAKFNADGSGQWIELSITNPAIAGYAGYAFADQADVLVNARLAADAVGATKMDRPEWCATHPGTGEIYFTLTNNSTRKVDPAAGQSQVDAANPRSYSDSFAGGTPGSAGNVNGHILRVRETGLRADALGFKWDVYLFGAEAGADPAKVNLSSLTSDQDFSSPDGLWFSQATGICWIQTDDGAYTDVSNCMMLAAVPGKVGDGETRNLAYTKADGSALNVTTRIGKTPQKHQLKRFLVGPKDCEITGCCETPDGRALFINIQHPGERTSAAVIGDPSQYTSHWPGSTGYGAGGATARPRSSTIVITKDDGGRIGT